MASLYFITAIYGKYEATCKPFVTQTVPTDFICFTENPNMVSNGWIIDTTPYHLTHPSVLDTGSLRNSIKTNKHTFNIAKYYKQAFQNIPRLQSYDVIVWLDGTVEITNPMTTAYLLRTTALHKIVGWHHEWRFGQLDQEVNASNMFRYTSTHWNNQEQPYQNIFEQYNDYLMDGYDEDYFRQSYVTTIQANLATEYPITISPHIGVWITCFVAFLNHDSQVRDFLNVWYTQTLRYTTQDQIGFPYALWKQKMIPYTLPNHEISGDCPHQGTQFYIKHDHGK